MQEESHFNMEKMNITRQEMDYKCVKKHGKKVLFPSAWANKQK